MPFIKGYTPWNKGVNLSTSTRLKMSKTRKGVLKTLEHKRKISEARKKQPPPKICTYRQANIPRYDLFVNRLEPVEQCRRNIDDSNILEVRCTYCGKWFIPLLTSVLDRLQGIETNDTRRIYCSSECKKECPIYGRQSRYKGQQGHNSREVQPELRQLVFERDLYICKICGSVRSLHCHHIDPVINNPIESADVDNCVTLCKTCHKQVHKLPGCGYHELRGCTGRDRSAPYQ